jgi:UDP-N-acetylmuramate-alanine ligase
MSKYLVVEADDYRRAFLNLFPTVLVVNNIDEEHLD